MLGPLKEALPSWSVLNRVCKVVGGAVPQREELVRLTLEGDQSTVFSMQLPPSEERNACS